MITLDTVSKSYRKKSGWHDVLRNISVTFPKGRSVGILGRNGAGKSTLLRLIGGVEQPDKGRISREMKVSWPVGFTGGIHGDLTGRENARFVARIYGADLRHVVQFTESFAEIGDYFDMPIQTYSTGMRARLSFGLSMACEFECYLVDEITAVGDYVFQKKCKEIFNERRERASVIMVSHNVNTIKQYCDMAAVLSDGHIELFETVEAAAAAYSGNVH
jgi:capsular polysaccharide transport system ATP-binding protein